MRESWKGLLRWFRTGYRRSMTVEAIKEEIGHLSEEERKQLLDWLEEVEEETWDREMERNFSPGGQGTHLAEKIDQHIDDSIAAGDITSLEEGLRTRRERRVRK